MDDCLTPKRKDGETRIFDSDVCFRTLNKLTTISNSPRAPTINDFAIIKPISRGAFGKVFLGFKGTDSKKLFAIKVMRKSDMINKNMISQVITERNALALSRSQYCVNLFYSLQTSSFIYLVMEYMVGGDLKSLLAVSGYFDESAARFYCAEVTLALEYLHGHGIVHRDIKPDNMLVSISGHVKLTDFGLSKIELSRDLEMSDLINCSPSLNARTPGQLLSLTSHLSFGSCEKKTTNSSQITSTLMHAMNRQKSPEHDLDNSNQRHDDSHVSGVSPFQSAEDINVSFGDKVESIKNENQTDSASSYYTCNSSVGNNRTSSGESFKSNHLLGSVSFAGINNNNTYDTSCHKFSKSSEHVPRKAEMGRQSFDKENKLSNANEVDDSTCTFDLSMKSNANTKGEDSGVSSRKSELSGNIHCELSAIEKVEHSLTTGHSKDDFSSLDFSKSYSNQNNTHDMSNCCKTENQSPSAQQNAIHKCFKRPACLNGVKRKRSIINRIEHSSYHDRSSASTGLTQEIDIMDIGSSTPKKRKAKSPLKGVLKVRSLSDDEMPHNEHLNVGNVMFSTPVSSQKAPRGGLLKLKSTRFALPSSADVSTTRIKDPAVSPINARVDGPPQVTPKNMQTPYRTPKSVRRTDLGHNRILGTPDYLSPELLLSQGHGPAVDWWALGVCLYEFMTGVPPFNDETPQKVFDNILSRNIEYPEGDEALSDAAMDAVEQLLTMDPESRPTAKEVQLMSFFDELNWTSMESVEPPFVPTPDDPTDTGYFTARNIMQHLKLSSFDTDDQ